MYVLNVNELDSCVRIFHQMMVISIICIICRVIFSDVRTTLEMSVPRCALMCYP